MSRRHGRPGVGLPRLRSGPTSRGRVLSLSLGVALVLLGILAVRAPALAAQELSQRIRSQEGLVSVDFATDQELRICEPEGGRGGSSIHRGGVDVRRSPERCSQGVALAVFEVERGVVSSIEVEPWFGTESVPGGSTYLGHVTETNLGEMALDLARRPRSGDDQDLPRTAVFLASLGGGSTVWRPLLEMARDRGLGSEVREAAVFWVGQHAAEEVTRGLAELASEDDDERRVREAALFALSRRGDDVAVPALIEIAQDADDPHVRRSAIFWLGESGDPRALEFFEEILLGGRRGR